jgi:hypothetical protein
MIAKAVVLGGLASRIAAKSRVRYAGDLNNKELTARMIGSNQIGSQQASRCRGRQTIAVGQRPHHGLQMDARLWKPARAKDQHVTHEREQGVMRLALGDVPVGQCPARGHKHEKCCHHGHV